MAVLITGVAGFVGSHLADALLHRGEAVVGLDAFAASYSRAVQEQHLAGAREHPAFRFIEGDIRDPELAARVPDDVRSIVHLAAYVGVRPSVRDPGSYADVNVTGTSRLLQLAAEREMDAFVFASSSSVYGDDTAVPFSEDQPASRPVSPYAASKRAGELFCHAATDLHGFGTICLRLFTVYGPRQRPDLAIHRFARLMRDGHPIPVFGDGSSVRDYTYVADTVRGLVAALDWSRAHPGRHEVVNLGSARPVRLQELIQTLSEELGVEPEIRRLPSQAGDVERTLADLSKARALLGYAPEVGLREGLRSFLRWLETAEQPIVTG